MKCYSCVVVKGGDLMAAEILLRPCLQSMFTSSQGKGK